MKNECRSSGNKGNPCCYCRTRTKTEQDGAGYTKKRRVAYCCFCGEDRKPKACR